MSELTAVNRIMRTLIGDMRATRLKRLLKSGHAQHVNGVQLAGTGKFTLDLVEATLANDPGVLWGICDVANSGHVRTRSPHTQLGKYVRDKMEARIGEGPVVCEVCKCTGLVDGMARATDKDKCWRCNGKGGWTEWIVLPENPVKTDAAASTTA